MHITNWETHKWVLGQNLTYFKLFVSHCNKSIFFLSYWFLLYEHIRNICMYIMCTVHNLHDIETLIWVHSGKLCFLFTQILVYVFKAHTSILLVTFLYTTLLLTIFDMLYVGSLDSSYAKVTFHLQPTSLHPSLLPLCYLLWSTNTVILTNYKFWV